MDYHKFIRWFNRNSPSLAGCWLDLSMPRKCFNNCMISFRGFVNRPNSGMVLIWAVAIFMCQTCTNASYVFSQGDCAFPAQEGWHYTNICTFKIILMHTCTYVLWLALSRTYTMKVEIKVSLRAAKWLINLHETFMTDFKFPYLELWIWNTIIVLLLYLSVSSVFHVQNSSINCNQQLH